MAWGTAVCCLLFEHIEPPCGDKQSGISLEIVMCGWCQAAEWIGCRIMGVWRKARQILARQAGCRARGLACCAVFCGGLAIFFLMVLFGTGSTVQSSPSGAIVRDGAGQVTRLGLVPEGSVIAAPLIIGPRHQSELRKGIFLVASRYLGDPNFAETVVLLVNYGVGGAMGVVINRPTNVMLSKVFPAISQLVGRQDLLYLGGPVAQDRILLLMRTAQQLNGAEHVFEDIFVSISETDLQVMLSRPDPRERFHAYVGYAGWGPGQLEDEIARGDWHPIAASADTVFDADPSEIWQELLQQSAGFWVRAREWLQASAPIDTVGR